MRGRTFVALLALSLAVFAAGSAGATGDPGFMTSQDSMLTQGDRADVEFKPIITVGETLGSYRFESIPDGISLIRRTQQKVDLYVNHETSLVAFPYVAAGPTAANSQNDFDNSQLSQLSLNPDTGGVIQASMAISTSQNYQRFCSNYLATRAEGFSRATLFTNEEAQDWVFRSGTAWTQPIPPGTPGAEQPGVVAAHDVRSGQTRTIYGMGRFNHENDVALPGFDGVAVLSGDDTFSTTPASSQLYLYTAGGRDALWNDRGTLHAFVADDTSKNDYFDVQPGDVVSGTFVSVPEDDRERQEGERRGAPVDGLPGDARAAGGDTRRPAVGPRPVGQQERHAEPVERRVRLHPDRGHGIRQAARHVERRLPRGLGPRERPAPRTR